MCGSLVLPSIISAGDSPEAQEPLVEGAGVIELIDADTLEGWKVPSECWTTEEGVIIGDTGLEPIPVPEWLYTEQSFADFILSSEFRLTGSKKPNSGIYYRVKPVQYQWKEHTPIYEAATGYEYDVVPGKFCASLGDWYARPKLRVFADLKTIQHVYKEEGWNRATLRARGNRFEYWLNGVKLLDYIDEDPEGSREGIIGLQIHNNAVMKVEYRYLRVLPIE